MLATDISEGIVELALQVARESGLKQIETRAMDGEKVDLPDASFDAVLGPAQELAALYHERWEIETALDELKTHLRGARIVLRSKTPDLVRQEFYGLLMAHFAVRALMHEAALTANEDPDRLSFIHAVRVVRRKLAAFNAIPPWDEENLS